MRNKRERLLLILLISWVSNDLYSQTVGLGGGLSRSGGSFSTGFILTNARNITQKYFLIIGTNNLFTGRSENNTYDFSPSLFDDQDRGELKGSTWMVGGVVRKLNNEMKLFVGGGVSVYNEYFKRYDESEILGDGDGIYFLGPSITGGENSLEAHDWGQRQVGRHHVMELIPTN